MRSINQFIPINCVLTLLNGEQLMVRIIGSRMAVLVGFLLISAAARSDLAEQQQAFFNALENLCGATFVGETVYPDEPGEDWRGKELVAVIEACSTDEIRIPLAVGENRSRTWVITRTESGLQLKHDHRHADGTPDDVTQYGGMAVEPGTAWAQSFPADGYTADLIPDAATNEWFLSLSPDGMTMTYYLERHGAPRFRAVLKRID